MSGERRPAAAAWQWRAVAYSRRGGARPASCTSSSIETSQPPRRKKWCQTAQDEEGGGISDRPEDMVDVYHTFFGIAGGLALVCGASWRTSARRTPAACPIQ